MPEDANLLLGSSFMTIKGLFTHQLHGLGQILIFIFNYIGYLQLISDFLCEQDTLRKKQEEYGKQIT